MLAHSQATPSSPPRPKATHWVRRQLLQQLRRVPPLHRAAKELWVGAKLVRLRLRQARRQLDGRGGSRWQQSTLRFDTPLYSSDPDALLAELQSKGLAVQQGRHTMYVGPQPGLEAALGPVVRAYPPKCGFKILKRFAAPAQAQYLYETDVSGESALMGTIFEQALAGAALAHYDLGPRVIDVVHLRGGHQGASTDLTAIVVEHVHGRAPTHDDHRHLLHRLDALRDDGRLALANPGVYACSDFDAPGCNGNLLVTPGGELRYVDAQAFMFDLDAVTDEVVERHREVLHFGDRLGTVRSGQGFLYQGLPGRADVGRRDPDERWQRLDPLLREHGLSVADRVVFDVCCNAGLMMTGALRRGARWAVGWDLPEVAAASGQLLPLLGAGRSTVIGKPVTEEADLAADVPPWLAGSHDAVCLFLAAWHHVGFPPGVGDLPWQYLVYEGREHEDDATITANIATMRSRWGARAIATHTAADGLCGPRPVVLLHRDPRVAP